MIGALIIGGAAAAPAAAYLCKKLLAQVLGILVGIALVGFILRTILIEMF